MHMNRPGKLIKASTIEDLPKENFLEPRITISLALRQSLYQKLVAKSNEYGYKKSVLVHKALEAYLK